MTWLLLALVGGGVGWYCYRRWQATRLTNDWWRDQIRRELQEPPEAAHWRWDELKDRDR